MSTELQAFNGENKLAEWAVRISECRNSGQSVKTWCRENGIREQTYYRWQKRLFEMTKAEHDSRSLATAYFSSMANTMPATSSVSCLSLSIVNPAAANASSAL